MKLFKCYSTDECTNEQKLEESLNKLKKEGKIEYDTLDRWTIKVTDIDLDIDEEKYLIDLFDKLEVYPLKDDDDLDLDQLIEEYNKLTEKYKTKKNDILYKK